jgi:hypothetical protein
VELARDESIRDESIRDETTLERLAGLRPSFCSDGSGTITAGNASPRATPHRSPGSPAGVPRRATEGQISGEATGSVFTRRRQLTGGTPCHR